MISFKTYLARIRAFHPNCRLFLWLTFFSALAGSCFGLVFNLYVLSLGHTMAFVGTLEAVSTAVTAVLAIPLAYFSARLSYRHSILAAYLLGAVSVLGMSLSAGRMPLIMFKALGGLSGSLAAVVVWPFMTHFSSEDERPYLFSFQFALATFSGFLGNLLAGQLARFSVSLFSPAPDSVFNYRVTMLAGFLLSLAACVPAVKMKEGAGFPAARRVFRLERGEWLSVIKIMAPQFIIGYGAGMVIPFVNIFLKFKFRLPIDSLGTVMAVTALAMGLGGLAGPYVVKKRGKARAIVLFQALSLPFLVLMGFSSSLWPAVIGVWARTSLMNASGPIYSVFLMEHFASGQRGLISAVYSTGWNLASSFGSRTSGTLQMMWGFDMPFLITLTTYAAATLLVAVYFGKLKQGGEPPSDVKFIEAASEPREAE